MGFSEKMRESLGAEGARIEVLPPGRPVSPGGRARATVAIVGGTRAAQVDALIVRIVEADRHWVGRDGARVEEERASSLADRRHLTAGWDRHTASERRITLGQTVEPGERHEVEVELDVPAEVKASSVCCSHTLNVQADIKGQIDPAGNARLLIAPET